MCLFQTFRGSSRSRDNHSCMNMFAECKQSSQVNRTFCTVIASSPLIQHKIDLLSAGLEYNASTRPRFANNQTALQYRSEVESLYLVELMTMEGLQLDMGDMTLVAGGVLAIMKNDSLRLSTLGSVLRGILHEKWKVPLLFTVPDRYAFYLGADAIAFVKWQEAARVHFFYRN